MNKQLEQVRLFHKTFNQPAPDAIAMISLERAALRAKWTADECQELTEAVDVYDQVDAAIDQMYFAIGTLVELGIKDVDALFDIVQQANMGKLWADGLPHFREDGKIIKPEGWEDPKPKLMAEIDFQIRHLNFRAELKALNRDM